MRGTEGTTPDISFIVPARNAALSLPRTLVGLQVAALVSGQSHEVIVVDDGSSDESMAVASLHGARVSRIEGANLTVARNAGARDARGRYLFFVDVETLLTPSVITAALHAMDEGAAGGSAVVVRNSPRLFDAWVSSLTNWICAHVTRQAAECFVFCTRPAFDSAGGFRDVTPSGVAALAGALKTHGRFVVLTQPVTAPVAHRVGNNCRTEQVQQRC